MNIGPIIAGIAFGLLVGPPSAIAGGFMYCGPSFCWGQPYPLAPGLTASSRA